MMDAPWSARLARAAAVLAAAAAVVRAGPDEGDAAASLRRLPAALRSADGRFAVVPGGAPDERAALLRFAGEWVRELSRITGLALPAGRRPMLLSIAPREAGSDARVAHALFRSGGEVWAQLTVFDTTNADPRSVTRELTAALLRTELHRRADPRRAATDLPPWLPAGLARHAWRAARLDDAEGVLARWSRGRLPAVWDLVAADAAETSRDPALAAQVAAWLLDQPGTVAAWDACLRHLAAGGPWDASAAGRIFLGNGDTVEMDENWDRWLVRRGLSVIEAGATPPGVVRRFRAQLLIYPADYGMCVTNAPGARMGLDELLSRPADPWTADVAAAKAAQVRGFAAGRDASFRTLAESYARVLDGFRTRTGAEAEPLASRWRAAERWRGAFEASAAAGETRRDPAGEAARPRGE